MCGNVENLWRGELESNWLEIPGLDEIQILSVCKKNTMKEGSCFPAFETSVGTRVATFDATQQPTKEFTCVITECKNVKIQIINLHLYWAQVESL